MHRNSAGFVQLPLIAYGAIGAAVVIASLGIACKVQTSRLASLRAEYEQFKGGIEALGLAAKKAVAEKEAQDQKRKEQADELHRKAVDSLNADIRRLRARHSSERFLSAAASCPSGPARAAEFRTEYQHAYGTLVAGLRGLGDEGSKAVVDLDAGKIWAQQR